MPTPQSTVTIVYDYDQTLSPSYMQEDVIFPAFGINGEIFWRRCVEQIAHGVTVEHYIISSGLKVLLDGSRLQPYVRAIFGCEFDEDDDGRIMFPRRVLSHTQQPQVLFPINKGLLDMSQDVKHHMESDIPP